MRKETVSKIAAAVVVAILVGTSSPWWWKEVKALLRLTPSDEECSIEGRIFDEETNRPISGVWIDLYRWRGGPRATSRLKALAATTGPEGRYVINCTNIDQDEFPIILGIRSPAWRGTRFVGQTIEDKDEWKANNIPTQSGE